MTMCHRKRGAMLIVIRGTLARQEWAHDFTYSFANHSSARAEFAGRVHQVRRIDQDAHTAIRAI